MSYRPAVVSGKPGRKSSPEDAALGVAAGAAIDALRSERKPDDRRSRSRSRTRRGKSRRGRSSTSSSSSSSAAKSRRRRSRSRRGSSRSRSRSHSRRGRSGHVGSSPKSMSPRGGVVHGESNSFAQLTCYDDHDKAPEDRLKIALNSTPEFEASAAVVRGTLSIDGVNYSTFEAHKKDKPHYTERFLDSLREDIISEVGNGVRKEDILLKVYPGSVKTVVLHYDEGTPQQIARGDWKPEDPKLINADWSFTVDYAIRARNNTRQQRIAAAMFAVLSSDEGLNTYKTRHAYVKWLDPTYGDPRRVAIRRPALQSDLVSKSQEYTLQDNLIIEPPATRAISPQRKVPVDGVYPASPKVFTPNRVLPEIQRDTTSTAFIHDEHNTMFRSPQPGTIYHHPPGSPERERSMAKNLENAARHHSSPIHASPMHGSPAHEIFLSPEKNM